METTVAEKFRYYANHPEYIPEVGICKLLRINKEYELLSELRNYMIEELGSSSRIYLQTILFSEDWDITSREVYLDWDNRPRIENPDSFAVGDKVIFEGKKGVVVENNPMFIQCLHVVFEDTTEETFTCNGRYTAVERRILKHA